MMTVNSVLGKIGTEELGTTLIHEHVICCDWSMRMAFREKWFEREVVVQMAVAQLKKAKERYHIQTVVDGTAINLGRDIELIKEVSQKSGVHMIASTGMYFNEEPYLMEKPIGQLVDLLLKECEEGIEGTNILPGIIKTATDSDGITPLNQKLLYMTSILQKETRLPVFAHSDARIPTGLKQQDELERNGADLSRIVIGHSGDTNDLDYLEELMKRGSYIGMDRFGDDAKNSLENRIHTIYELCQRGWIGKMVLSHDYSTYIDWNKHTWEGTKHADYEHLDVDYTYIHRKAIPMLLRMGLTEGDLDIMMVDNVKKLFEE